MKIIQMPSYKFTSSHASIGMPCSVESDVCVVENAKKYSAFEIILT